MAAKQVFLTKSRHFFARALSSAAPHAHPSPLELSNGLRVSQEVRSESRTAAVSLVLDLGSRNESGDRSGATSLLLRSLLADSSRDLTRIGARLSADVSRDSTSLVVRCLPDQQEAAVQLLARLLAAQPSADHVESARKQLLRDISAADRDQERVVLDNLHKMAYQGTGLEANPLGTAKTVRELTLDHLNQLRDAHVKGPRAAFALVSPKELTLDLEPLFGRVATSYDRAAIPQAEHARFTGSDIRVRDDALPLAHVAICVEGPARDSPDHLPLALASELVGQWDASFGGGTDVSAYLGRCSAVERLTHQYRALWLSYRETSLLGALMVCERMKLEDAVYHLTLEWKHVCAELTNNELARAKNTLLTAAARAREDPGQAALLNANSLLQSGAVESLAELEARVLAVNAKQVRAAAEKYLWDRCAVVSALGPVEQLEDYEVLRGKFYWFRY